jgi:hypothetical protein
MSSEKLKNASEVLLYIYNKNVSIIKLRFRVGSGSDIENFGTFVVKVKKFSNAEVLLKSYYVHQKLSIGIEVEVGSESTSYNADPEHRIPIYPRYGT